MPTEAEILDNMYAPFFGSLGCTAAMALAAAGAAYGTARSGSGIAGMSVHAPQLVMRGLIPVIMAGVSVLICSPVQQSGIVAIYGLVVAVILGGGLKSSADEDYTVYKGFAQLASGLVCGLCGIGAGYAIGIAGDAGVRAVAQQQKFFVGMVLILIFAEVLGLYGMIVALVLSGK